MWNALYGHSGVCVEVFKNAWNTLPTQTCMLYACSGMPKKNSHGLDLCCWVRNKEIKKEMPYLHQVNLVYATLDECSRIVKVRAKVGDIFHTENTDVEFPASLGNKMTVKHVITAK